jgi:hypothetical protein
VHGVAEVFHNDPSFKVQTSTIEALRKLNGYKESYPLSVSGHLETYRGVLGFEVGVAEGVFFNNLDDKTVRRLCDPLNSSNSYHILDFLIIATYHYSSQGKMLALNFDHYLLRFIFNYEGFELRLFHSKGTRRMPLDELLNRVFDKIRERMQQSFLEGITVKYIKSL